MPVQASHTNTKLFAATVTCSVILSMLAAPSAMADDLGDNAYSKIPAASLLTIKNADGSKTYAEGDGGDNYDADVITLQAPAGMSCTSMPDETVTPYIWYFLAPVGTTPSGAANSALSTNSVTLASSGDNAHAQGTGAPVGKKVDTVAFKGNPTSWDSDKIGPISAAAKAGNLTPDVGSDPAFGLPIPSDAASSDITVLKYSWYTAGWARSASQRTKWDLTNGTNPGLQNADGTKTLSLFMSCDDYMQTMAYTHITINLTTKAWAVGDSLSSSEPTKPVAPSNVKATAKGDTVVNVSWDAVNGASKYAVNVYKHGEASLVKSVPDVSGTSVDVTGLTASTAYDFKVVASNGTESSDESEAVSATTQAPVDGSPSGIDVNANVPGETAKTLSLGVAAGTKFDAGDLARGTDGSIPVSTTVSSGIKVTDNREDLAGWSLSADLNKTFSTSDASAKTFEASGISYAGDVSGNTTGAENGSGDVLAKAAKTKGKGDTNVKTTLNYTIPASAEQGEYSSKLTLTLVGSAA